MRTSELVARHPRVFHVAARESWSSIQQHGLMSAERLLALHGVQGERRSRLIHTPRREAARLSDVDLGVAWIRDQKPLKFIDRKLEPGVTLPQFLEALSSRVFFAPTRERLDRLLKAREYEGQPQVVLTLDTSQLVERCEPQMGLCRFDSGAVTQLNHPARGPGSWLPVRSYPYDDYRRRCGAALVEVTVEDAVPDALELVTAVEFVTP